MNVTEATGATLGDWLASHDHLPRVDREQLLCDVLGIGRASLIANPRQRISRTELVELAAAARRLAAGEPLAYILGERGFWDFTLRVSPAVLIPRPETETLVEQALERILPGQRVLDLGTGSGAIAIALARTVPANVTATDRDPAALAVARDNAERLGAPIRFLESDWFSRLPDRFDLIVANPPYIRAEDPHLAALHHEPASALVGGASGLEDLAQIISGAPRHLNSTGWLLVEHGYDQAAEVLDLFAAAGFLSISMVRDLGGQPRVTLGQKGQGS